MAQRAAWIFLALSAATLSFGSVKARDALPMSPNTRVQIAEGAPTLAPFQHVRFCLRYPAECKSSASENVQVELSAQTSSLLKQVNHSVNVAIMPTSKAYGPNLADGWTIAPGLGDCNDYAVTKRHDLVEMGLPARAMRLAAVKTAGGVGHLVLVVNTTGGELVMDNLTQSIRPWQNTGYQWIKIQSAADSKFWYAVSPPAGPSVADQRIRVADR